MIHKEMTLQDLFDQFPQKGQKFSQELTNKGLACTSCSASTFETIEAGMLSHGYSEQDINNLIVRLNGILEEKLDADSIILTPRAAEKFKEISKADGKEDWGLKFADKPGGCGGFEYTLDFQKEALENDAVYQSQGIDIFVDKRSLNRLLGSEIDYLDGLNGSGFKISNPNVKASCSCGSSQSY